MDQITIPSGLLSCFPLIPLRGQEARQKQVVIGHRGRSRIISRFATEDWVDGISRSGGRNDDRRKRYGSGSSSGRRIGRKTSPIRWTETPSESVICMTSPSRFHRPTIKIYFPSPSTRGTGRNAGGKDRKKTRSMVDSRKRNPKKRTEPCTQPLPSVTRRACARPAPAVRGE